MRVLQLRDRPDFAPKSLRARGGDGIAGEVEGLYDDLAVECTFAGEEHARHSATTELPTDREGIAEGCLKPLRERVHARGNVRPIQRGPLCEQARKWHNEPE